MNIAIRKAIKEHEPLTSMLTDLSRFAASSHQSTKIANIHASKKSKLKTNNATRWSSAFLMMQTFLKCFANEVFSEKYECPVEREDIELYSQILRHCYFFQLLVQRSDVSIAQVVPLANVAIQSLSALELEDPAAEFRDSLIAFIRFKFDFELKSPFYAVAALLDVAYISVWFPLGFGPKLMEMALASIESVYFEIFDKEEPTEQSQVEQINNKSVPANDPDASIDIYRQIADIAQFASHVNENKTTNDKNEIKSKIFMEKNNFHRYLFDTNEDKKSTSLFWLRKKDELPHLFKLARFLIVIPASSAFVEGFFSIAGIITSQRASNTKSKYFCERALLRANAKYLDFLQLIEEKE